MTNLPDFMRRLLEDARTSPKGHIFLSTEDRVFIEAWLREPVDELHFRARPTGRMLPAEDGEQPEMELHYTVRGEEMNVFCLMSEAAMRNARFYHLCKGVVAFMDDHASQCPKCQAEMATSEEAGPPPTWEFKPFNQNEHV